MKEGWGLLGWQKAASSSFLPSCDQGPICQVAPCGFKHLDMGSVETLVLLHGGRDMGVGLQ